MSTAKISDLSGAVTPLTGAELVELSQLNGGVYGSVSVASKQVAYAASKVGAFSKLADTTGTVGVANTVTFDTTNVNTYGVTLVSSSRVTVDDAGLYIVLVSAQFANTDAADHSPQIWIAKNGVAVAGTNSIVNVPKAADGGSSHFTQEDILTLAANDYVEVVWMPDNAAVKLDYTAAGAAAPSTPAVTVHVMRIAL